MEIHPIAHITTDFPSKFGIPRQSGLKGTYGTVIFEREYRCPEALRGLEDYSHLWLIWEFTEAKTKKWQPTVRPPRLGGNTRMGVFATRSPFRPNSLGLSCVKLIEIRRGTPQGDVLIVEGADILSGTPIYDIKPYLPFTDAHPDAKGGFGAKIENTVKEVHFDCTVPKEISEEALGALSTLLLDDPRPGYSKNCDRIYSFEFAGFNVKFKTDSTAVRVVSLTKLT